MGKFLSCLKRSLNGILAALMGIMVVLVFGNVVLRYLFNSGITWAEEVSRYSFVWLVFIGAIVALSEGKHMYVDVLVSRLSPKVKNVLGLIVSLMILYVLWLFLDGSIKLLAVNKHSTAPATGWPLNVKYVAGVVAGVAMIAIVLYQIIRLLASFKKSRPANDNGRMGDANP
jgi:TRAP-type C4-dicarboxylate transport system permease small subunit